MSFDLEATSGNEVLAAQHEVCMRNLQDLQRALLDNDPDMPTYLSRINEQLREFPALMQLLSDEEITVAYQALMKRTGVHIEVKESKAKNKLGKLADGSSVGDLL